MATKTDGQLWVSSGKSKQGFYLNNSEHYNHTFPLYSQSTDPSTRPITVGDPVSVTLYNSIAGIVLADGYSSSPIIGVVSRQDAFSQKWEVIDAGETQIPFSGFLSTEIPSDPTTLIGSIVYVGSFMGTAPVLGAKYTFSRTNAGIGDRKINQVGFVTQVDATNLLFTIMVSITGDSQGPVGTSQVSYTLGMDIPSRSGQNPYILAIAQSSLNQTFNATFNVDSRANTQVNAWSPSNNPRTGSYLAINGTIEGTTEKFFYASAPNQPNPVIPNVSVINSGILVTDDRWTRFTKLFNTMLNNLTPANYTSIEGVVSIVSGSGTQLSGAGFSNNSYTFTSAITTPPNGVTFISSLGIPTTEALDALVNNAGIPLEVQIILQGKTTLTGNVEVSNDSWVTLEYLEAGLTATQGNLIIADKKLESTSAVVGILMDTLPHASGDNVLVQKIGTNSNLVGLDGGDRMYLGDNGEIIQDVSLIGQGEWIVPLGIAINSSRADFDLGTAIQNYPIKDDVPLGATTIIPGLTHGNGIQFYQGDNSWLHCNGASITTSDPVYGGLFSAFISQMITVGTLLTGTSSYPLPNVPNQIIKIVDNNVNNTGLTATALRQVIGWTQLSSAFVTNPSGGSSSYTISHNLNAPLSGLIAQVYVNSQPNDIGSILLKEGPQPFMSGSNALLGGYTFVETQVGAFSLWTKDGLCYLDTLSGSILSVPDTWYIKVVLYEPKIISNFVDVTADSKLSFLYSQEANYTSAASTNQNGYMTNQDFTNLQTLLTALNLSSTGTPLTGGVTSIQIVP